MALLGFLLRTLIFEFSITFLAIFFSIMDASYLHHYCKQSGKDKSFILDSKKQNPNPKSVSTQSKTLSYAAVVNNDPLTTAAIPSTDVKATVTISGAGDGYKAIKIPQKFYKELIASF